MVQGLSPHFHCLVSDVLLFVTGVWATLIAEDCDFHSSGFHNRVFAGSESEVRCTASPDWLMILQYMDIASCKSIKTREDKYRTTAK